MAEPQAAPMNFKAMATKQTKEVFIKQVQLSGSVAMKILQHCQETDPTASCGQLLGLDAGSVLEVTECFPFLPTDQYDEYQLQKMRCLRDINVDTNVVGWYQSAPYGGYQTVDVIDTFISYDDSIKRCVCIICDVKHSQMGGVSLRAIRLDKKFMQLYKANPILTAQALHENKITWRDMFVEVPVKVENSPLITALMAEIESHAQADQLVVSRLKLNTTPYLEKHLELMGDGVDALWLEAQDMSKWSRQHTRLEQQKAQWLQKRIQENIQRKQNGEELLPEDDPNQFKPIDPPSMINSYLHSSNLATVCANANTAACELINKLQLADCFRA